MALAGLALVGLAGLALVGLAGLALVALAGLAGPRRAPAGPKALAGLA